MIRGPYERDRHYRSSTRLKLILGAIHYTNQFRRTLVEDKAFHAMIYRSVTNKYLTKTLANISDLINLCRPFSLESTAVTSFTQGHMAILDAVMTRDVNRAKEETRKHIRMSRDSLLTSLKRQDDNNAEINWLPHVMREPLHKIGLIKRRRRWCSREWSADANGT